MITVVTYNQDKIFGKELSKWEVPVKFSAAMIVVMSYKLGKEDRVFCNKDDILKPIIPSIFWSTEVVVTGESAGKLEMAEKLSMDGDFFFLADRHFLKIGTVDKDYVGMNWIRSQQT